MSRDNPAPAMASIIGHRQNHGYNQGSMIDRRCRSRGKHVVWRSSSRIVNLTVFCIQNPSENCSATLSFWRGADCYQC